MLFHSCPSVLVLLPVSVSKLWLGKHESTVDKTASTMENGECNVTVEKIPIDNDVS